MTPANLFGAIPADLPNELAETLVEGKGSFRIVRIVSQGHSSPDGFWYDEGECEWVALLEGEAILSFEDAVNGTVTLQTMRPGDWILIPPRSRHRVESTSIDPPAVWLAMYWT